jgi:hypothetical protein
MNINVCLNDKNISVYRPDLATCATYDVIVDLLKINVSIFLQSSSISKLMDVKLNILQQTAKVQFLDP